MSTYGRYQPGMIIKIRDKFYRIIPLRNRAAGRGSLFADLKKAVPAKGEAHR